MNGITCLTSCLLTYRCIYVADAECGCHGNRQLTENSLTSLSAGTFRGLT